MKKVVLLILIAVALFACEKEEGFIDSSTGGVNSELYSGGIDNTVFDVSPNAFGRPSPALSGLDELNFFVGNSFFNQNWVTAPASTTARDGLGPNFNARSCSACHFKDGRGRPPAFDGENATGFLMRLSLPGTGPNGEPIHHPSYGDQLNPQSILGVSSEGEVYISYTEQDFNFPDGEVYSLRIPIYNVTNLNYGGVNGTLFSPRIGQQMIGLGLLETINETDILELADELDIDGDGISGKANYVYDVATNSLQLGRFGWKANQPNLRQQTAAAFVGDIGITTNLFPVENCTNLQNDCMSAVNGGVPELLDHSLDQVELYVSNLSVPARRDLYVPNVTKGKEVFNRIGCTSCHQPEFKTGINTKFDHLSNQIIYPYTDLLLHDMGAGLSDNRPDFLATGNEWRTPPLWGVGLIETVNNHTFFLHDGRARNLTEAIMWHGGEAENTKDAFYQLPKTDRDNLLTFLKSL